MMWSPRLAARLGLPFAAHPHAPLPRLVDVAQLFLAVGDLPAGREVGPLDVLEEVLRLELGIVEHRDGRRADLAQVVGRDVGRHADGDPGAAVDEQLRHLGRQHDRLLGRAVVVGAKVDRPLLDLVEQVHRQRRQARLGVAVRGRRIAVERAEVAVPVDQRDAHRERLRQADHRLVAGRVAVRVELAEHVPHDRSPTCGTWRPGRGGGWRTSRRESGAAPASGRRARRGARAR